MDFKWSDATSYSQGQRGKVSQTAWETVIGGHRIWLSCGHIYYPGNWVMNCSSLGMKESVVADFPETSEAMAKLIALDMVRVATTNKIAALQRLADALEPATPGDAV